MRKRNILGISFVLIIILALLTNPTKENYIQFSEKQVGEPIPPQVEMERINFYIFSTYTPIIAHEHGSTYLGVLGNFIQISDGQFDYSWWLELFN